MSVIPVKAGTPSPACRQASLDWNPYISVRKAIGTD
jgi:hypothetical protein